jgi:hypothetical protein
MKANMAELNGNEKYFRLSDDLPTNASKPGAIQARDLMIYGSNTLVLFYKSSPTQYEYTRLGRIVDTNGLPRRLARGASPSALRRSDEYRLREAQEVDHEESVGF